MRIPWPVAITVVVIVAAASIYLLTTGTGNGHQDSPAPLSSEDARSSPSLDLPLPRTPHASAEEVPSALDRGRDVDWREATKAKWRGGDHAGAIERWKSTSAAPGAPAYERRDATDQLMVGLLNEGQASEAVDVLLQVLAAECTCAATRPATGGGMYSIWLQDCRVGEVETLRDRVMVSLESLDLWDPAGPGPLGWVLERLGALDSKLATEPDSQEKLGQIRDFLRIAEVFGPPAMESTTERALARAQPMVSEFLRRTETSSNSSIQSMRSWLVKRFGK